MTHAEWLALRRFPALDGLRAVAAVMVIVSHTGGPRWLAFSGWTGVHVFFVLSGFLITTLLLRETDRVGRASLGAFWIRRVFRIVPVYLAALGLAVVAAVGIGQWAPMVDALPAYLTMTSDVFDVPDYLFRQAWTIGIEERFYLLWPLLAFGLCTRARSRGALVTGLAAVLVILVAAGAGLWVHYAVLLAGCALALILHDRRGYAVLQPLTRPGPAAAVLLLMVAAQVAVRPAVEVVGEPWTIVMYTPFACVLLVSLLGSGHASQFLATSPLRWVGERSYALYLVAQAVALTLAAAVPALAVPRTSTAAVDILTALAVAALLHTSVERPGIRLGRVLAGRISRKGRREVAPTDAYLSSREALRDHHPAEERSLPGQALGAWPHEAGDGNESRRSRRSAG